MSNKLQESELQKGVVIAEHRRPVCVMRWHHNKCETMISVHHAAEIWTVLKREEEEKTCVCDSL